MTDSVEGLAEIEYYSDMISFNKPTIKRKDMDSVLQALVDEQIGHGERCAGFMQQFAETVGCTSAVAYRTYSDCLESALKLYGAEEGTKVALSPLSPSIYKTVLDKLGCELIPVDVDKENGMPSEQQVASSDASILMLYEPCSSLPLKYNTETTFAEKMDYSTVSVIEDVTTSIGSHYRDEFKAGDWGKVVVCALEDDNIVSTAGGAALAVRADMIYSLRGKRPDVFTGLSDLNAALGSVQLQNLSENNAKRREISKVYSLELAKTKHKQFGLNLLDFESASDNFAVFLDSKPEEIFKFAEKHDVPARFTFENSVCSDYEGDLFVGFPNTAAYFFRTISFPVYPFLKSSEIESVSKVIAHLP